MSLHYNAFISYKHAELDNKVAAAIEWDLEHYHIPRKIQKKTGFKKIERIFRDKDELPITSDLSNTIEEALFNSDYLIVLCSTNTHLSTWVEREIKLFLQNHPQENVLTVLVDGEPHDVIPQILQNREVEKYNEKGELVKELVPVEPLSCDYRLPRREAKSVELPRLAATLIGCSYNELMNRQRQYKMKRLTAIFSGAMALAVGFGAYMLYSNARINENYTQSLISQSKYLANASGQLLDAEKRIDALHLALEALPNEKNPDRPVIPEAVRAITKASLAYTTETGSSISATWNYTMDDLVKDYITDKNSVSFAAMDMSHNIRVWNRETHELLYEYSSIDKQANYYTYIGPDVLMICSSKYIQAVDVLSGTIKWEIDKLGDDKYSLYSITEEPRVMDDGSVLVGTYDCGLYKLSAEDGTILDKYIIKADSEYSESATFKDFVLSPDQKHIMFCGSNEDFKDTYLYFYDLESREFDYVDLVEATMMDEDDTFEKYEYIDKDTIMIVVDTTDGYGNYSFLTMDVLADSHKKVYCIDANELRLKWIADFEYNAIPYGSRFFNLKDMNGICFSCGNIIDVWDKDTGELLHEYNVNESIVGAVMSDGDTYPSFITRSGKMGNPATVSDVDCMTVMQDFTNNINMVAFGKGAFINTDDSHNIIFYQAGVHDEEYQLCENGPEFKSINEGNSILEGDILAALGATPDGSKTIIAFYDANTKECIGTKEIGGEDSYIYSLTALHDDVAIVTFTQDHDLKMLEINAHTLEVKETLVEEDYYVGFVDPIYTSGKLIYFRNENYEHLCVVVKDLASNDEDTYEIGKTVYNWGYNEDLKLIYVATKDSDYVINLETHDHFEVIHTADWEETKHIVIDSQYNRIMASDDQYIHILDLEGNDLYKIVCPNVEVYGMAIFTPKGENAKAELLVAYGSGDLYRYDAENGEYIARVELAYNKIYDNAEFIFDMENNMLFLQMGPILNVIELDSWNLITYLGSALAYHEKTDTFLVYSYSTIREVQVGYFRHYTVEELIQKGREMLRGQEMSEELKKNYGIG